MNAWDKKRLELYDEGYKESGPYDPIDIQVCNECHCPNCGRQGGDYYPMRKPNSYRAFVVCPQCGEVEEF